MFHIFCNIDICFINNDSVPFVAQLMKHKERELSMKFFSWRLNSPVGELSERDTSGGSFFDRVQRHCVRPTCRRCRYRGPVPP